MSYITINKFNLLLPNNRKDIRKKIVDIFLIEEPGKGKGDLASRYKYEVEVLTESQIIYLLRPAFMRKGFDFTVNVDSINFNKNIEGKKSTKRPSHEHIFQDLKSKKLENPDLYKSLLKEITKVYNCNNDFNFDLNFESGYSSELILKLLKWLFIEQDIRDWSYSGREMLFNTIMDLENE